MRPTRHGIRSNREWPCSLFIVVMWILCSGLASALAQTVTTNITSSGLNTTVTPNGTTTDITGGTRPGNGTNLFHSFGDFSVGNGHTGNFHNETNLPTTNILSRVTGGNVSNIFGTLKTTDFGNAALWLINPAGIVFGPNASLDVGGSVHFSTADYLKFTDGAQFFASLSKASQLTSVPVEAFGFLGPEPPKAIDVRGATLTVPDGEALSLIGGNTGFTDPVTGTTPAGVTITGSTLTAPRGEIKLESYGISINNDFDPVQEEIEPVGILTIKDNATLSTAGTTEGAISIVGGQLNITNGVTITSDGMSLLGRPGSVNISGKGVSLDGEGILLSGTDVTIEKATLVAKGIGNNHSGRSGGPISITAGNAEEGGSVFIKESLLDVSGQKTLNSIDTPGSVEIRGTGPAEAAESIILDHSTIKGSPTPFHKGATISLHANTIELNESTVDSSAHSGSGGSIQLQVDKMLTMKNSHLLTEQLEDDGSGGGGPLELIAPTLNIRGGSLSSESIGGNSGPITLNGEFLEISDALISTGRSVGGLNAGIPGSITFQGLTENAPFAKSISLDQVSIFTSGPIGRRAGPIRMMAETISLKNSTFSARTRDGQGGNIELTTPNLNLIETSLSSEAESERGGAEAGSILLNVDSLLATRSLITTSGTDNCAGCGVKSGSVIVQGVSGTGSLAKRLTLNQTTIESKTILSPFPPLTGGGSVSLLSSGALNLTDSLISVLVEGGNGVESGSGNSNITLTGSTVNLSGGMISAETGNSFGQTGGVPGGNISVKADRLTLSAGATISTSSTSVKAGQFVNILPGTAGDVSLISASDIFLTDSSIRTEAAQASGGNIKLTAPGIVLLNNAQITSSVNGPPGSNGGNIGIDPEFVVLANGSQILAQAFGGNGGNIDIVTNTFFAEPGTLIDASSQLGISGTITINSPVQNLSGTIAPLPKNFTNLANLYAQRCAGQKGGQFSSFVQGARDALPPQPGEALGSPMLGVVPSMAPVPVSKTGKGITPQALRADLPDWSNSLASHLLVFREGCPSS